MRRTGLRFAFVLVAALFLLAPALPVYAKPVPSHRINLNTATLSQLEELPDVGSVMAHSILKFRKYGGPFERVDDLLAIRGISHRRLDKIRPYVYVGKEKKSAHSARARGKSAKNAPSSGSSRSGS